MNKHNTASINTARVKESFSLKNATIFGGVNILPITPRRRAWKGFSPGTLRSRKHPKP